MYQKIKSFLNVGLSKAKRVIKHRAFSVTALALSVVIVIAFTLSSVHTFNISDGNQNFVVHSMSKDTDAALKRVNLNGEYKINNVKNSFFSTNLEISYLFPLTVTLGKTTNVYNVNRI